MMFKNVFRKWARFDLFAILLLIALPVLVFWQVWAPNKADRVMFGGDLLMGGYASRVFVHHLFAMGSTPIWNPYQLGGMPLLGDIQVAPYYLPNLLLDLLYRGRELPYIAVEFLVIAHYCLGALFLYAYLRGLGVRPAAALIGAVGFEFNGFFVGHRGHYNMLAVVVWLPGVLWLLDRAWWAQHWRRAVAWAICASLALSQMVVAGHPQVTLYCAVTIVAYTLYRWFGVLHQRGAGWQTKVRIPSLFLLAGVLAGGIAAVTLLPAAELLGRSLRNELSYSFAEQYSLLPRNLVGLLIPEFLGWSGTEFRIYAGILTLLLATVAWIVPEQGRPERRFFGIAAILALVTALGGFTVLHGLIYRFVPGFASIRVSTRAFYIANLALDILAAFGAETLLNVLADQERQRLQKFARFGGVFLAVAVLMGAGMYLFLVRNYQPVSEDFFFAENLFSRQPVADTFGLLTQTANAYLLFVLLLALSIALLWARHNGRLSERGFALSATVLMFLDVATFTPYHDTIKADPSTTRFTVKQYQASILKEPWQIADQQQMIDELRRLPDGVRIDNAAEVLPDNYSAVWQTPFATGYNILDLQERAELLTQWPPITDTLRRDILNVGYVLTAPDAADPPESGARLIVQNSQGTLWKRAQQPSYAHFSTALRPVSTSITTNALLNAGQPLDDQPPVTATTEELHQVLQEYWPEAVDPALYQIGTTGVQSPVDISVLAGGAMKYSAVIINGVTVTPQQRGIVVALIDPQSGKVQSAKGYDTYLSETESNRLAAEIGMAPDGTIVALATYDEGITKLNGTARTALASLGATADLHDKAGAAYALIGVKGSAAGSALEQLAREPTILDVGAGALSQQKDVAFASHLLTYQPDRITLLIQNNVRGLLTVSEATFPGWEAYVDGLAVPIIRANGLQRAVILPPALDGRPHEVTFAYRPLSGRIGSALSLSTLALAIGLALSTSWSHR